MKDFFFDTYRNGHTTPSKADHIIQAPDGQGCPRCGGILYFIFSISFLNYEKTSNLGHFFLQVLSIMQIGYLPKIEFGIKAALNVILAKDSWILALLVMDQTVKSIVPVCKNF